MLLLALPLGFLAAQNLISNPSFEEGSGDEFANWTKVNGATFMTATTAPDEVRTGSRALRSAGSGFPGEQWQVQLINELVPTVVGEAYTFTIWAKAASAGANIRFSTQPNPLYGPDTEVPADTWTQLSWTFTANESLTSIVLDLGQTDVVIFLDDAEMNGPSASNNAILNPSFEEGTGDEFTNWTKVNGAEFMTATTDPDEVRTGSRALRSEGPGFPGEQWRLQLISDPVATVVGQSYTFTIWAKAAAAGANIRFSTQPNPLYGPDTEVPADTWTQLSWTFTANEANTSIVLDLGQTDVAIFLDDAEMDAPVVLENILPNPSFEEGEGDEFTSWDKQNGAEFMTATTAPEEVRTGNRALRSAGPGFPGEQWQVQLINAAVPTIVGSNYTFSIWAKAAAEGANVRFSTQPNALYGPNTAVPADTWTKLSWTFTANEEMTRMVLDLGQTDVVIFLDDAEMFAPSNPCSIEYEVPAEQQPIALGRNKFLGSIYSPAQRQDVERYFNQITPENAGKWGSVERVEGVYDFTELDEAREVAAVNGFPFRFHVLLWGSQQPTWLKPLSDEQKVEKIRAWFQAVADHYDNSSPARATLEYLEVVNEFINDPPNNLNNPPFGDNTNDAGSGDYVDALKSLNEELGTEAGEYDWIVNAFKLARQYFPCGDTKLMLNEYNVLTNFQGVTDRYLEVVALLQADDLIDVLGLQGHAFSTRKYDAGQSFEDHTAFLRSNVDRLAATGLPVMVTELDIDGNTDENYNVTEDVAVRDAFQKQEYERVLGMFWEHPAIIGVTLWGFRNGHWRSDQLAYLIDPCTGLERPALREYLNNTLNDTPNSIRASGDQPLNVYDFECAPSSVADGEASFDFGLELYPNPAQKMLRIQFTALEMPTLLSLYDGQGRVVLQQQLGRGQESVRLDLNSYQLADGIYYLSLLSSEARVARSLVIQR